MKKVNIECKGLTYKISMLVRFELLLLRRKTNGTIFYMCRYCFTGIFNHKRE